MVRWGREGLRILSPSLLPERSEGSERGVENANHLLKGNDMRYMDSGCTYTEDFTEGEGHTYTFTGTCCVTGEEHSVKVNGPELFAFRQSDSIMALESLTPADREFLISGTSPEGWELMFGVSETDDEEWDEDNPFGIDI